ncbi:MAG TPA: TIGR02587 family membrane protein [Chloroflexota bacterium]|nr:TIGR02587 family membrane protein [Chloroflexota bacterium]
MPRYLADELHDLTRALGGALLFGIPLLLTMEVWWLGGQLPPWQCLGLLAIALVVTFPLVRSIGFKRRTTFRSHADQAVHAVAIGIVAALAVLLVLNRLSPDDPPAVIASLVAVQALPLSLGAAVANAVFKRGEDRHEGDREGPIGTLVHKLGAGAIGAAFIAFSAAPTEEIAQIAAALTYRHQLALFALTLVVVHAIVFHSGYHPDQASQAGRSSEQSVLSHLAETSVSYAVALGLALLALLLYNRTGAHAPLPALLTQALVLGLPAAIGGAAGRLVL